MSAHGSDVSSGFTTDPEYSESLFSVILDQLTLVNSPDSQVPLDGRNDWRTLEHSPCQLLDFECEFLGVGDCVVESDYGNVFFSGLLLRFDQTGGSVDADDETTCCFGVQSA